MKLWDYLRQQKTATLINLRDKLNELIAERQQVEQVDLEKTLNGITVKELEVKKPDI